MSSAPSPSLVARSTLKLEDDTAHPLLAIGFRPFFLLAALSAVVWIPLWLLVLEGNALSSHFPPAALHAHEMLYGFTAAVIAGFLLTAGANWTGQATTTPLSLALLALFWTAGRVAMLSPALPRLGLLLLDVSFFPALGVVLAIPIVRSKNWRNLVFLALLLLLTVGNALMHLENWSPGHAPVVSYGLGKTIAVRAITLMLVIMGGRVIPMFTRNGAKVPTVDRHPLTDRLAIGAFLTATAVDLLNPGSGIASGLWLLTGALHVVRMRTWGTRHARAPLLWILHAGYASVAVSFVLEGLTPLGWVPPSSALHLLTVGGIGGLCLGMMTRVSLGHSGRMLVAPRSMAVAFGLWGAATAIRVFGPLTPGVGYSLTYVLSGIAWTGAFLLLLWFGAGIWFSPRADRAR